MQDVTVTLPIAKLHELLICAAEIPALRKRLEDMEQMCKSLELRYSEILYILRSK